jgi:DNA repair exonuclease SbcCD nuclease subunit
LLRRHESLDTTAWLAGLPLAPGSFGGKPRIVLAHGSVLDFGPGSDEDEGDAAPANHIDLSRLPAGMFDYVALGDWHGMKQVGPHAWYSGTPEPDRFPKGPDNQPGHILVVEATRGDVPRVTPERTARLGWHALAVSLAGDDSLAQLDATLHNCLGTRVGEDLLRLELSGELGITAATELEKRLEAWSARLLRLKLSQRITLAPTEEELDALTRRTSDPLISRVAQRLVADLTAGGETGEVARVALRELHAAVVATA